MENEKLNKTKIGFTLAEVLITLGIIGVVAALTIPAVVRKYNEQATVTMVKKFYSVFSQAYTMAVLDNGTFDTWGLGETVNEEPDENGFIDINQDTRERITKFFQIMEQYLKKADYKQIHANSFGNESTGFVMADGTDIIAIWLNTQGCINNPNAICGDFYVHTDNKPYLDENNKKKPNIFAFKIFRDRIVPYGLQSEFNSCLDGSNYSRCTAWVIANGNMDYLHCKDLSWNGKTKCK